MKTALVGVLLLSHISGFSANICNFDVKLEQYLVNEGFHRNITYKITFGVDFSTSSMYEGCTVGLDQTLPPGVFANSDELYELRRQRKLLAIPKNRVNIEMMAEQSEETSVYIIAKVTGGEATLWLPVHARYHEATDGGFVDNEIEAPRVYLRCPDAKLDECDLTPRIFLCNGSNKEKCNWRKIPHNVLTAPVSWSVPVGDQAHYTAVACGTLGVVVAATLYLMTTLHDYKVAHIDKKFQGTSPNS